MVCKPHISNSLKWNVIYFFCFIFYVLGTSHMMHGILKLFLILTVVVLIEEHGMSL